MSEDNQDYDISDFADQAGDAEFQKIVTQRFMYNANLCKGVPLVGDLLNIIQMPPIRDRNWSALLIRTNRPTLAVNREKQVVKVEAGQDVLIPATFEIMQFLAAAAQHEKSVFEVRIRPDKKIDIGKGQTMWLYDLASKPIGKPRSVFGLPAVLTNIPQLPATVTPSEAEGAITTTGEPAPF